MIAVRNPRTGAVDFWLTPTTAAQVADEAQRLRVAQPSWAALAPDARADTLRRWADVVEARRASLIEALAVDTGRWKISEIEIDGLPRTLRRWAERGPRLLAELATRDRASAIPGIRLGFRHSPYPLFGAIAPWNFPIVLSTIDAIPALMAGCAALVKPSEVTPRVFGPLRETVPAELPLAFIEGGPETGQALIEAVDYLCFTGSVATGRKVAEAAARAFIPANLELGGKDPMIVLASADPVAAAGIALRASVLATGQACQSIERVYVDRAIAEPFLHALVHAARACRINYPNIRDGDIGPFIFARQAELVQAQIEDAVTKGARVLTGGTVETHGGGRYLCPTVIADVTPDMAVMREETFGPVVPVTIFDTVDEAVALANAGDYGLGAAVLAGTPAEAEAVGARLEAGAVSINDGSLTAMVWDAENTSFKRSGLGPSRMGDSGLARFLRTQALIRQTGRPLPLSAYAEDFVNPLRTHMPLMLAHEGEWDGTYRRIDAEGALLDEHRTRTSCIFPDEGEAHYIQHSRLSWADGRSEEYRFAATYRDGLLRWDTGRFHGVGWETNGVLMLRLDRRDVPGAYYVEMIVLGEDGRSRARTWQWFRDGRPWKRTLCDEWRID